MAAKSIELSQKRKIYKRRWATTLKRDDRGQMTEEVIDEERTREKIL